MVRPVAKVAGLFFVLGETEWDENKKPGARMFGTGFNDLSNSILLPNESHHKSFGTICAYGEPSLRIFKIFAAAY